MGAQQAEVAFQEARHHLTDRQSKHQQTRKRLEQARLELTKTQQRITEFAVEANAASDRMHKCNDALRDAKTHCEKMNEEFQDAQEAIETARKNLLTDRSAAHQAQHKLLIAQQDEATAKANHKGAVEALGRVQEQRRCGEMTANHTSMSHVRADADANARSAAGDHSGKLHVPAAYCAATEAQEKLKQLYEEQHRAESALPDHRRMSEEAGRTTLSATSEFRRLASTFKISEQAHTQSEERHRAASAAASLANAKHAAADTEANETKNIFEAKQQRLNDAREEEKRWVEQVSMHENQRKQDAEEEKEASANHDQKQAELDRARAALQAARLREANARRVIIVPQAP